MFRGVLSAYLLLVTVAGPCASCCAAIPVAAPGARIVPTPPPAPCSGSAACTACGHCCSGGGQPAAPIQHSPTPCPVWPCDEATLCRGAPAVKLDEPFDSFWFHRLLDVANGVAHIGADQIALPDVAAHEPALFVLPFLTASDLLHVHHRLRC